NGDAMFHVLMGRSSTVFGRYRVGAFRTKARRSIAAPYFSSRRLFISMTTASIFRIAKAVSLAVSPLRPASTYEINSSFIERPFLLAASVTRARMSSGSRRSYFGDFLVGLDGVSLVMRRRIL